MSFGKRMGYKPYKFKFDEAIYLAVKSKEEVERINETLKEESPESDYESYSWYLIESSHLKITLNPITPLCRGLHRKIRNYFFVTTLSPH